MSVRRIGSWGLASAIIKRLSYDLQQSRDKSLRLISLYAEKTAITHLRDQDLNWKPLKPNTLKRKLKVGESEKTLIATSSYFQSITSWLQKDTALVGVKRNVRNKQGQVIANIARVHEFGSPLRRIPKRPLWKPTLKETIVFANKEANPAKLYLEFIKKKYGV